MSDFLKEISFSFDIIANSLYNFWWIIFPVLFYQLFKIIWRDFVVVSNILTWKWVTLEITPPKEIERSPKVMEAFYAGISGVITSYNTFETYLHGKITDRFSLELEGREGALHFYVKTQKKWKKMVESQIYAQYPDAEIIEVDDYADSFPKVVPNKDWNLWGVDFELTRPDPYPIKTYDKFEEDITGTMIDPLSAIAEVMGKLGPGQHIWLQYVLEPLHEGWRQDELNLVDELSKKAKKKENSIFDDIKDVFSSIFKGMSAPIEFSASTEKDDQPVEFKLTPGEKEVLKAVEENLGKNAFRVKMRMIYIAKRENWNKSFVGSFIGALKQFNDLNLNNFKPNDASKTYAHYLWKKERMAYRQRKIYKRFRQKNMDGVKFVLTTKELATVFHFPDMSVKAPAVSMTESKKGSAPSNLPI